MEMSWNSDTMMMTAITADSTKRDDLLEALVKLMMAGGHARPEMG